MMAEVLPEDGTLAGHDFVVIGSGFATLAFIDQTLALNAKASILCLERGSEDATGYLERLQRAKGDGDERTKRVSEIEPSDCPWQLTNLTTSSTRLNRCAGMCFLLGGRSNYWHGWCMQPKPMEMSHFPPWMLRAVEGPDFWTGAKDLLGVRSIKTLHEIFFADLQRAIDERLDRLVRDRPSLTYCEVAHFAHADRVSGRFARFSVADRLLALSADVWVNRAVFRLGFDELQHRVKSIETSRGTIHLSNPNVRVILCSGVRFLARRILDGTYVLLGDTKCNDTVKFIAPTAEQDWPSLQRTF